MEIREPLDFLDLMVPLDFLVLKEQWVLQELMDCLVCLALMDPKEREGLMVDQEKRVM